MCGQPGPAVEQQQQQRQREPQPGQRAGGAVEPQWDVEWAALGRADALGRGHAPGNVRRCGHGGADGQAGDCLTLSTRVIVEWVSVAASATTVTNILVKCKWRWRRMKSSS